MKQPILQPTQYNTFVLLEDFVVDDTTVPQGYETNGANIPRIFWIFIPPFKPMFLRAIVVHDYLSEIGEWDLADTIFETVLKEIEDSLITTIMAQSVYFHTWYWKQKLKFFQKIVVG